MQASFGRHDISRVRAHVGGAAGDAARSIGAVAYATGNDVAFASQPDLFTSAHEAAHVVQQRAGIQLKGGVGQEGDLFEQHADRVAHLVVQGRSAEAELDLLSGVGGTAGKVQSTTVQRMPGAPIQAWAQLFDNLRPLIQPLRDKPNKTLQERVLLGMWEGFFDNLSVNKAQVLLVVKELVVGDQRASLREVIGNFKMGMLHGAADGFTEDIRAIFELPGMLVAVTKTIHEAEKKLQLWGGGHAAQQLSQVLLSFRGLMQQAQEGGMALALFDALGDVAGEVAAGVIEAEVRKAAKGVALNFNRLVNGGGVGIAAVAGEFGQTVGKAAGVVAFNVLATLASGGGALAFNATRRAAFTILNEMNSLAQGLSNTKGIRALGERAASLRRVLSSSLQTLKEKGSAKVKAVATEFDDSLRALVQLLQGPQPALAGGGRLPGPGGVPAKKADVPDNAHAMEWASDGERHAVTELYGEDLHVSNARGAGVVREPEVLEGVHPAVKPIAGRRPPNFRWAGKVFPASELPRAIRSKYPHGVPFTQQGFPDFARYRIRRVEIALTGDRGMDRTAANAAAGLARTPSGYVWHHNQASGVMELIPADLHEAVRHAGGVATSGLDY